MGCCVSVSDKSSAESLQSENRDPKQIRAPPCNPFPEEESVKEVLSETPSVPKKLAAISRTRQENYDPKRIKPLLPYVSKIPVRRLKDSGLSKKPNPEEISEEASSEIRSTRSGRSVSTGTDCTEKNDDDGERSFRQRDSREYTMVGKPPAKRSTQSPGRLRSGSSRDACRLGANGHKRDSTEISGVRSRSPANRPDGGGPRTGLIGSVSSKKSGKSPGGVKPELGDKIRRVDDYNGNSNRERREDNWPPTSNESLENPLVSLECFIFL